MPYLGKVIGTLAGLATGRIWLALIGLVIGHQFDRGFAERFSRIDTDGNARLDRLPEPFVRTLFQTMGAIAKSDGRVTEDEIRAARALMHRLGLGGPEIRQAIECFQHGKEPSFPLRETLKRMRRDVGRNAESRRLFVRLLMEVSLAKGKLQQSERALLWKVCGELDISRVDLAQLEAMLRAQRGFRQSPHGTLDTERVQAAYAMLGVSQSATNDEIKKAYRRLMNRNHPDKIASSDPDDGVLAAAHKRTRDIRGAYEMLKARRSIR
jgi:DnaJ like chaperone protein